MATHYNRATDASIEDCRKFIALRVEAVNHALRGIPQDRVRFHTCYSVNIAPRVHDFELKHFVDLMLRVNAGAYLIEAANPRHEHEWAVWRDVKLPDDKILVPGVVSHCIHLVEHPELVAQRIVRFADVVGRERVIAGTDCGFGTSGAGDEVHPEVAWAKLRALVEGARMASERLWSPSGTATMLARPRGALDQRAELELGDLRIDLAVAGEGAEAAVGAGDDALAADHVGEAHDALRHQFGMLDIVGAGVDHAGQQDLVVRQLDVLPHRPFVLVARIGGLDRERLRVHAEDDAAGSWRDRCRGCAGPRSCPSTRGCAACRPGHWPARG